MCIRDSELAAEVAAGLAGFKAGGVLVQHDDDGAGVSAVSYTHLTIACRASVKSNDVLSIPEMQALLKDLFACEMPYCCPHGRPTLVQISTAELERKFGRRAPG